MSDSTIRIIESIEELDDLAATESSRAKLNRLAVLKLYALFVRSGETEPVPAIARSVGVAEDTVEKWLTVYGASGISGLMAGGRRGVARPKSRKPTSRMLRDEVSADSGDPIETPAVPASDEDTLHPKPDPVEAVMPEDVMLTVSLATDSQADADNEPTFGDAPSTNRHTFVFADIEEDPELDDDQPVETPRPVSRSSSIRDGMRLRAEAGRRAIRRAANRILRKEDTRPAVASDSVQGQRSVSKKRHASALPEQSTDASYARSTSVETHAVNVTPSSGSTAESLRAAGDTAQDHEGLDGAWVLVAETDAMIASIIRHRLEKRGANVVIAQDGMEVVSTLWRRDFDLLVTAVALPGLDGFEITRWVRDSARHKRIPVMVTSWPGNESDLVRAFEAGADDFVYKPFSPVELITRLKRLKRSPAVGTESNTDSDAE